MKTKNILKLLLLFVALSTFSASAQAKNDKKDDRAKREEFAERQAKYIANELAMDDATTKRFVETYRQQQQEMWSLRPQGKKRTENRTDAEAEQAIKGQFDHSQKMLDLKKKYYGLYSQFLTPKQIERMYQIEHKMKEQLQQRHKQGKGKGKRPGRPKKAKQ